MKKILFFILALGLFSNSLAQDLLVSTRGYLIPCKILAQTDQLIFISKVQPDGSRVNSYVSKDTIRTISTNYLQEMSTLANKTAVAQMNRQIRKKNRSNGRPITEVARFAVTAGYSHLLDFALSSSNEYNQGFSDYGGFTVNGDLGGFFNDYMGLGAFANYSHYNKKNIHNLIVGPKLLIRVLNHKRSNAFIFGWGIGYNYLQMDMWSSTAHCGTFGTTAEWVYEVGLTNKLALMFNLNAGITSTYKMKIHPENYAITNQRYLVTVNLSIGIVFGR